MDTHQVTNTFYVYCTKCKSAKKSKVRPQCGTCNWECIIIDPPSRWTDIIDSHEQEKVIQGTCYNCNNNGVPRTAKFYMKCPTCGVNSALSKSDILPMPEIVDNTTRMECLACNCTVDALVVFPCKCFVCVGCWGLMCEANFPHGFEILPGGGGLALTCRAGHNSHLKGRNIYRIAGPQFYAKFVEYANELSRSTLEVVTCPLDACKGSKTRFNPIPGYDHLRCPSCSGYFCKRCNKPSLAEIRCQCKDINVQLLSSGKLKPPPESSANSMVVLMLDPNTGEKFSFEVYEDYTVKDVKQKLIWEKYKHLETQHIELHLGGAILDDAHQICRDCSFAAHTIIQLVLRHQNLQKQ